ncbi:MAG: hypothetical protein JST00_14185 [Deltaproteobacteria bacterium]|nr:hypothetical protein [Deltaproteobacteria bacterium]
MKRFLAVYIGTEAGVARSGWNQLDDAARKAREAEGMRAWMEWSQKHAAQIVDLGAPLGKTKQVSPSGITDLKNAMAGYTVIEAESHEAAAKLFENHPHFTIFPGESVELMECMPIPTR